MEEETQTTTSSKEDTPLSSFPSVEAEPYASQNVGTSSRQKLVAIAVVTSVLIVSFAAAFSVYVVFRTRNPFPDPRSNGFPQGCLWVGHLNPDVDSYCTSMAAAEIFAGTYSISAPPNRETEFVVERFGFPDPPLFVDQYNDDVPCVGLVDHNQKSQSPLILYDVPREKLKAIIDHHAIQSDAVTVENVIHVDVRPWGSASTLLYETFLYSFKEPTQGTAQCMLSAILSDTIGLTGPTTTYFDIEYADFLAEIGGIDNITELYLEMGKAKSDIEGMTTREIITFDGKEFFFQWASGEPCSVYWATFETFSPEDVLDDPTPYIDEMKIFKEEKGYELVFFSVVNSLGTFNGDTENLSALMLIGDPETSVAMGAYDQPDFDKSLPEMDLSPRVSRKKDFIPPLDYYISHTVRSDVIPDSEEKKNEL